MRVGARPGGCGPCPRCGTGSGTPLRFGERRRGSLPPGRGGGCRPGGDPGAGGSAPQWAPAGARSSIKRSNEESQPAPDGRVEGWVFAGEMRGSCLQLAYKVPVLGSQDLPGSQRAKTERGGAAARSRGDPAQPGAGIARSGRAAVPGAAAFPALGPVDAVGTGRSWFSANRAFHLLSLKLNSL
ncbi:uncharacterized protein ACIB01_011786 isoform 1-T1 [Guaruba guarouba]